jgi:hypothetical protein
VKKEDEVAPSTVIEQVHDTKAKGRRSQSSPKVENKKGDIHITRRKLEWAS